MAGIVPVLLWSVDVSYGASHWPWERRVALCVVLHVAAGSALAHHFWPRWPWRTTATRSAVAAASAVFPFPALLVGLALDTATRAVTATHTLTWGFWARRGSTEVNTLWRHMQQRVGRSWAVRPWWQTLGRPLGLDARTARDTGDNHLASLLRVATWLLFLDTLWISAWSSCAAPRVQLTDSVLAFGPLTIGITIGALAVAVLSGCAWSLTAMAVALRVRTLAVRAAQRPWARYLVLVGLAVAAGVFFGAWLVRTTDVASTAITFGYACGAASALAVGGTLLKRWLAPDLPHNAGDPLWGWVWLLLALAVSLLARAVLDGEPWTVLLPRVIAGMVFVHLLTGATLGRWLTRPLGLRDLLAPGWPLGTRAGLLALRLSAALPFGGLAAPVWILTRDRVERVVARHLASR